MLYNSDLDINWQYSDSDSESKDQFNQADISDCGIEADEWTSLCCCGPNDYEDMSSTEENE